MLALTLTNVQIKTETIQWSGNERWPCKSHVPKMEPWPLMDEYAHVVFNVFVW